MTENRVDKNLIPHVEQYMEWIEGFTRFPHRRTGSEEGKKSAEYVRDVFEKLGLEDVRIEEAPAFYYEDEDYGLKAGGRDFQCFPINGTFRKDEFGIFDTADKGLDCDLIYLGNGDERDFEGVDVEGKIVLCHCPWFESSERIYEEQWGKGRGFKYDPNGAGRQMQGKKYDSYSPNKWPYNYCRAMERGAAGFVGILDSYFEDGIFYNEDYTEEIQSRGFKNAELPGLWIGTSTAKELLALYRKNDNNLKCDFKLRKNFRSVTAKNVVGILPGQSDEVVLVHSHHDAVFSGAVQDASGMSEVFGLAKYFSQVSIEKREKTLMFLGTDGHYTDYEGHRDFVKRRRKEGVDIIVDMVIEHVAREAAIDEDNRPIILNRPEIRMMYVTDSGQLWDTVKEAVIRNDIERTIMIPAVVNKAGAEGKYEFQQDEVVSDAFYNAQAGIPVVSILSPPMYLFHPMDKSDMVSKESLRPIATAYAEIIDQIMQMKNGFIK